MIVSYLILFITLYISGKLVKHYKLQQSFISTPFIGSLIVVACGVVSILLFDKQVEFIPEINRIFMNVFLFTIGFQTSLIFTSYHWRRVINLTLISGFLLMGLYGVALLFKGELQYVMGPYLTGFNEELLLYLVQDQSQSLVRYWGHVQMVIVFLLTPIFLKMLNSIFARKNPPKIEELPSDPLTLPMSKSTVYTILAAVTFVVFKIIIVGEQIPFLFDFVFTSTLGYLFGKQVAKRRSQKMKEKLLYEQNNLGTLGLYLYIMVTIFGAVFSEGGFFSYQYLGMIITKTIVIGLISLFLVRLMFRSMSHHEKLVAIVAGWTFLLNAPVVCMHGMRTVVNRFGPAPNVLLIVPPVVLWLINYLQLGLHLILGQ